MNSKINRRIFLSSAAYGMGAVVFSSATLPFKNASDAKSNLSDGKKLLATTDYVDNVRRNQSLFDRKNLDQLHKYLSSMGVTRHQWIVDTIWDFYERPSSEFDILKEAVESAHSHGLEFYAEIKPFEGGGIGTLLPHSFPFPKDAIALKDIRGIYTASRPFVARNPHMCLKRRPDTYKVSGPVATIRLVKGDDAPTQIKPEHLNIWTSHQNNGFSKYTGPVSFHESVEWRRGSFKEWIPGYYAYRGGGPCRILHLENLQIPDNHKYILIRLEANKNGDFTNERGSIIELIDVDGKNIPFIVSSGQVEYNARVEEYFNSINKEFTRYLQLPEVQVEINDHQKLKKHYQDFFSFNENRQITDLYTLDKEGFIAVACGKPEYMLGNLNPIYPEVRHHWLELVRYCLDKGVDGVNFRTANHTQSPEFWEYGFNEPVIKAAGGSTEYHSIRRINGDAYTQFLREARDLIKSRGKSVTIHLHASMLMPDDTNELSHMPSNFDLQWETWIRDIADDLEFRGDWSLRPWNLRQVIDTFSSVTREVNKPLYFQGIVGDGKRPWEYHHQLINMIKNDPRLKGFVLYETDSYTTINENGELVGSSDFKNIIKPAFT